MTTRPHDDVSVSAALARGPPRGASLGEHLIQVCGAGACRSDPQFMG
jgi:hypothetical protein